MPDAPRATAEPVHTISPTISEDEARRRLAGGRLRRSRRGRSLGLELLYLPHWLVVYRTLKTAETPYPAGSGMPPGEQLAVLVCRLSGQAAHIRLESLMVAGGSEPLPPILGTAEAEEQAADFVDRVLLMAARGKRPRERGRLLRSEPCGYPYWVEYLQRRRDIDFGALDAVSGKRAGAAVRSAIASGLTLATSP